MRVKDLTLEELLAGRATRLLMAKDDVRERDVRELLERVGLSWVPFTQLICPFFLPYPPIFMMQTTKMGALNDSALAFNRPSERRIFL